MTRQEIFNKVKEILEPYVKNTEAFEEVNEDTSILDDLQVNSARLVDIILAFEDEFDIEVDDEAADNVSTIGDAVELIKDQLEA
jgi:acyl carrier protein